MDGLVSIFACYDPFHTGKAGRIVSSCPLYVNNMLPVPGDVHAAPGSFVAKDIPRPLPCGRKFREGGSA